MTIKQLNESVLKDLYLNSEKNLGKQFYDEYPDYSTTIGGVLPLRNIGKFRCNSLDDFYWFYGRNINFNQTIHDRIMNALRYAKNNNMINSDMRTFLRIGWLAIEKIMNNEI